MLCGNSRGLMIIPTHVNIKYVSLYPFYFFEDPLSRMHPLSYFVCSGFHLLSDRLPLSNSGSLHDTSGLISGQDIKIRPWSRHTCWSSESLIHPWKTLLPLDQITWEHIIIISLNTFFQIWLSSWDMCFSHRSVIHGGYHMKNFQYL